MLTRISSFRRYSIRLWKLRLLDLYQEIRKRKMLLFLAMLLLTSVTPQSFYNFTDAVIRVDLVSSGELTESGEGRCSKIIAMEAQVYSLNSKYRYESLRKGSLSSKTANIVVSTSKVVSFSIDPSEEEVFFSQITNKLFFLPLGTDFSAGSISSVSTFNPNALHATTTQIYAFFKDQSKFKILDKSNANLIDSFDLPPECVDMAVSPNGRTVVFWTSESTLYIYNRPSMSLVKSYLSPNPSIASLTETVTFSQDSSLAVFEADGLNPVTIFDLATGNSIASFNIDDTIYQVHFLNSSNSYLFVLGETYSYLADLSSDNQIYKFNHISGEVYASDRSNNLFSCSDHKIKQRSITFTKVSNTDENTQGTTSEAAEQNEAEEVDQSQFYASVSLDEEQAKAYSAIENSLAVTTSATNLATTFVGSMPMTVYFLGFLNYFTLSSLYVLLNFPLPEHVYKYLSMVYRNVQSNLLTIIGVDIQIPALSDQEVNRVKPIFFGLSSDILPANFIALGLLIFNVAIICLLSWLGSLLKKKNYFRKLMTEERQGMIAGQVINIMICFTLPWLFLIAYAGIRNLSTKMNTLCYLLFFFTTLFFPFYFLFILLQQRKTALTQQPKPLKQQPREYIVKRRIQPERGKTVYTKSSKIKYTIENGRVCIQKAIDFKEKERTEMKAKSVLSKHNKFVFEDKSNPWIKPRQTEKEKPLKPSAASKCTFTLGTLLTFDILEQWHVCQANFIYPALIILDDPVFFLVPILVFSALGVAINFKKQTKRLNSFVLSLHPFFFHLCFMVFYWNTSPEVTAITQLLCLGVYLLGAIHHCLTLIFQILISLYQVIKKFCFSNKVAPHSPKPSRPPSESIQRKRNENTPEDRPKYIAMANRTLSKVKKMMRIKKDNTALKVVFKQQLQKLK